MAFTRKRFGQFPWQTEVLTVELSPEERRKAESLYAEMLEAKRFADQAQKDWLDYWPQLVLDHVPATPGKGTTITLPSGKSVTIPDPWSSGVVFAPDYRVAVPY
jgi:hypothetical protein